jgi:hypothetical protein
VKESAPDTLWSNVRIDQPIEDVRIIDLDVTKTTWSRVHDSMRVMYLKLSAHPPDLMWVKFFHEERERRINARRRGLWIENGYILIDCLPDEIDKVHLPDIRLSVNYANTTYRTYVEERRRERDAAHHAEKREIEELEKLRQRIRFDR